MSNYPNSGKGLKNMFIAAIGAIVCAVLTIIPLVNIVAGIAALVFAIISLIGLWAVGKDIPECKTAFWFTIGSSVVSAIANGVNGVSASGTSVVGTLLAVVSSALSLAVSYYVCTSVPAALRTFGAEEAAAAGDKAWKIVLWTTIASMIATILCLIPILNIIGVLLALVAGVAGLVGTIFYMIFLNKAYKAFGA